MKQTIPQQLARLTSSLLSWKKAFDSKEDRIIYIRKAFRQYYTSSDIWQIRGSSQLLYSVPGTIPLYVTMLK